MLFALLAGLADAAVSKRCAHFMPKRQRICSKSIWDNTFVYRRNPANRSTLGDYGNFNAPRTFGLEVKAAL